MNNKEKSNADRTIIITEKTDLKEANSTYEPYLIQISGKETGQAHKLSGASVIKIGRDPASQIILDDPHISRNHAEILMGKHKDTVIRDLGSTNGVFVNGKKITEQALCDGDKILIGTRMYFKFCYQDSVEQNYQQNLFRAANIDNLTQLYNKKYLIDILTKEFSFSRRNKNLLSVLMIDIDHFKKINDTYGHMAGDLVLKSVGQFLSKNIRLENIAARYGGEEFCIILRNVGSDLAFTIGERVRRGIEGETLDYRGNPIRVTISVGIATMEDAEFETYEDLLRKADENLYEAKTSGRNKTILKRAA